MLPLLVILAIFLAIFTQTVSGFGLALVSMSLLVPLLGVQVATPLVALVAVAAEAILVIRYRAALNLKVVWQLVLAAFAGIPLGVIALQRVDEQVVLTVLGAVLVFYAAYALLNLRLPELHHPAWAYGLGFIAGILGGAYNVSGPPVIVYGNCRRWLPAEFKGNLQGFFLAVSLFAVLGHFLAGNVIPEVWRYFLPALVGLALGILLGSLVDRRINPALFRRLVLVLLMVLGLRLIL